MSLQPYCRKPVIKIAPETSITEACHLMEQNNVGSLVADELLPKTPAGIPAATLVLEARSALGIS